MIDLGGLLLIAFSSLFRDIPISRFLLTQYPRAAGAIYGIPTIYIIALVVLIIISSIVYSIKSMIRRSVRRSIFDSVTKSATSSRQRSTPPAKPCPECGRSMRYINQYDKWYCDNCQDYK